MGPGWDHWWHRWPRQPAGNMRCLTKARPGWSSHLGPCSQKLLPSTPSRHPHLQQAPAPGHGSSASHQRCQLSRHVEALQRQLWMTILPTLLGQAPAWIKGEPRQQPRAWSQRSLPRQACREDLPPTAHLCQPVDHQRGLQAQLQVLPRQPLTHRVARCL